MMRTLFAWRPTDYTGALIQVGMRVEPLIERGLSGDAPESQRRRVQLGIPPDPWWIDSFCVGLRGELWVATTFDRPTLERFGFKCVRDRVFQYPNCDPVTSRWAPATVTMESSGFGTCQSVAVLHGRTLVDLFDDALAVCATVEGGWPEIEAVLDEQSRPYREASSH